MFCRDFPFVLFLLLPLSFALVPALHTSVGNTRLGRCCFMAVGAGIVVVGKVRGDRGGSKRRRLLGRGSKLDVERGSDLAPLWWCCYLRLGYCTLMYLLI